MQYTQIVIQESVKQLRMRVKLPQLQFVNLL